MLAQVGKTVVPDGRAVELPAPPSGQGDFAIRPLRAFEAEACEAFCAELELVDIRQGFGSWRLSVAKLLPNPEPFYPSIAFAAIDRAGAIIGIINLEGMGGGVAEIALIVRSDCKRRGVGRSLVLHAIHWAQAYGVEALIGHADAENIALLSLARDTGFASIRRDPFSVEVRRRVGRPRA